MADAPYTPKRFSLDLSVNLTHVITFTMGLITVVSMYFSIDKRLTRQEEMVPIVAQQRVEKDAAVQAAITLLTNDVKDVKQAVDRIGQGLAIQNAVSELKRSGK